MQTIPISQINVSTRLRESYNNIDRLADSLAEHGLIQPIVLNEDHQLVAGGRRLKAAQLLGWTDIAFTYKSTLDEAQLREFELEENVRREDMTWQERVKSIREIHKLRSRRAHISSEPWGLRETGEMLGVSAASIHAALAVAKALEEPSSPVHNALGMKDALKILLQQKENEGMQLLAKTSAQHAAARPNPSLNTGLASVIQPFDPSLLTDSSAEPDSTDVTIDLSRIVKQGDCIALMKEMPDESVDHVISDPPYAIDMGMLDQANTGMLNIGLVEATHQIKDNLILLDAFIAEAYRLMKPGGFCIFWIDITHFTTLLSRCVAVGFTVQRWPLHWGKNNGMNQAAGFNFTKASEYCVVCRKGNATLVNHQSKDWICLDKTSSDKLLFTEHPFSKPVLLWDWLYSAVTLRGQIVLDPFAGRGSSTVSAIRNGLSPIAFELEDSHFPYLQKNVRDTYSQMIPNVKFIE